MKDFYQFIAPTRVVVGRGLLDQMGFEFGKEGATRVLVVTDEIIRGTGLVDTVTGGIVEGGLEVAGIYDQVPPDSDTEVVKGIAAAAHEHGADGILAVGGGSVMDSAKAGAAIHTHGGEPREWEGYFLLEDPPLIPLGCIPTTAGTGSEVSFAAVIKDAEEHIKFQIGNISMYPRLAVLDPQSTATLPPHIAAATGMDAMSHAIEGIVSSEENPHGTAYALQALRLIRDNLEASVLGSPDENEDARGNMLVAANLAIMPTSSGAIGITHSMSHPAGAHFNVPHGVANAINLPWVVEYNALGGEEIVDRYREINDVFGLEVGGDGAQVGGVLAEHIRGVVSRLGLPRRLSEVGVPESAIPMLADAAMGDGCTLVNPREPSEEDFAELYARAL